MYYEIKSKRSIVDAKGNDKMIAEMFLVENCELFAEAEIKGYQLYNNENEIVAIKQSSIREFVNKRGNDEQAIYLATIIDVFIEEDGSEKETKYIVGLFAESVEEATKICLVYMMAGLNSLILVGIKRSRILDII